MTDLLMGGSPCQGFSFAGKQLNFFDPRSKLFFDFVKALEALNPKYFLLENVPMKQEFQDVISKYLGVEPITINSVLVSAQRRERLYWTNIPNVKLPKNKNIKIKDIVYDNTYKVFSDERIEKTKSFTKNYVKWDISGKGYFSQQDRAYFLDGTMCTVPHVHPDDKLNIYLGDDKYRRCHPIEAERLQTLPDNYTSGISASKRLSAVGNGWTVDVIAHILSHIQETYLHTVVSLFDGISCGQVALQRAGKTYNQYYASEIDKYTIQVTQKNYPHTMQIGDINKIDWDSFISRLGLIKKAI